MGKGHRLTYLITSLVFGALFGVGSPSFFQKIYESNVTPTSNTPTNPIPVYPLAYSPATIAASAVLGLIVGLVVAQLMLKAGEKLDAKWDEWDRGDKVNLLVGIFGGMIASTPVAMLLNSLDLGIYHFVALFGVWLGCVAATVYALKSMGDILPWVKERIPGRRRGIKILDTNVLIDGRVYDVARTGFLEGNLYVPGFVLDELQHIADSHDPLRRQRGRRGLDVLRMLQADYPTEVRVHDKLAGDLNDEVDARLVRLARAMGADIVTNDFNLNRVASLQQVKVLNLNDLALAMRPNVLPSEKLTLPIVREGNQVGQGVGYLEDGTMVVVENGKGAIGDTVSVTVTQVIQTERGKMIFGDLDLDDAPANGQSGDPRSKAVRRRV